MQSQEQAEIICQQFELDRAERHFNGDDYDDGQVDDEPSYPLTKELRRRLAHAGMEFTKGYVLLDGRRIDEDNVTCVWTVRDEPCRSLTFEEDEEGLFLQDPDMTPMMAVALAHAALAQWEADNA